MEPQRTTPRTTPGQLRTTALRGHHVQTPPLGGVVRPRGTPVQRPMGEELELLDDTPATWTGPHVCRRLCEAMQTLRELPMGNSGGTSCWPVFRHGIRTPLCLT
jgi:hypothetical protein